RDRQLYIILFAQGEPVGQAGIGIEIDEHDRFRAGALRLDSDMAGERRLARTALLGGKRQDAHRPLLIASFLITTVKRLAAIARRDRRRGSCIACAWYVATLSGLMVKSQLSQPGKSRWPAAGREYAQSALHICI